MSDKVRSLPVCHHPIHLRARKFSANILRRGAHVPAKMKLLHCERSKRRAHIVVDSCDSVALQNAVAPPLQKFSAASRRSARVEARPRLRSIALAASRRRDVLKGTNMKKTFISAMAVLAFAATAHADELSDLQAQTKALQKRLAEIAKRQKSIEAEKTAVPTVSPVD